MAGLALSTTSLMAQEKAEKAEQAKADAGAGTENKAWEAYMAVGPMHKMLSNATGDWKAEMSFWMAPGTEAQKSTSSCTYQMILGDRYQEAKVEGTVMGMPFEGRGLVGFDNIKKVFFSTWIDNMGTGVMYSEGPYDEKTKSINLKGTSMDPMTGKEIKTREVYKFADENHHIFEVYMMHEGKEFKSMEIHYNR